MSRSEGGSSDPLAVAVTFAPFWRQEDIVCSNPEVRVSLYKKAGAWLVAVANFTDEEQAFELTVPAHPAASFAPSWLADGLATTPGKATLTLLAKRGALIAVTGVE
jgi:hypothetical protein